MALLDHCLRLNGETVSAKKLSIAENSSRCSRRPITVSSAIAVDEAAEQAINENQTIEHKLVPPAVEPPCVAGAVVDATAARFVPDVDIGLSK